MKKTIFFFFLTLLPLVASAAELINDIYYDLNGNNKTAGVTNVRPHKYTGSVTIPPMVTFGGVNYNVTSIKSEAFNLCTDLTAVTIPNSVTSIGYCAFSGCSALKTLTIGNGVTRIGEGAFWSCSSLTSLTIPEGVTTLGANAFNGCNGLTAVTIPDGVTTIEDYAFRNCAGLTTLTIGSGVTTIGVGAFMNCPKLADVTCLAASVPTTSTSAFKDSKADNATLHVPAASVNAYKAKEPWKNFKSIVAIITEGVTATASQTLSIQNEGGLFRVQGADEGTPVSVYAADGALLGSTVSSNGTASVTTTLRPGSIAIVKVGKKTIKTSVR
jgi:hypothetical protein